MYFLLLFLTSMSLIVLLKISDYTCLCGTRFLALLLGVMLYSRAVQLGLHLTKSQALENRVGCGPQVRASGGKYVLLLNCIAFYGFTVVTKKIKPVKVLCQAR